MTCKVYLFIASICVAGLLALVLECEFETINDFYSCVPTQRNFVYFQNETIRKVNGTHKMNHTLALVAAIISNNVNFSYLPAGIGKSFPDLEVLKIEQAGLKSVRNTEFAGLRKVAEISLLDNLIAIITPTLFNEVESLERLRLSGNRIKVLPHQLFMGHLNFKEFYADRNLIEILPENIFKENVKLLRLSMMDNRLKRILVDFEELKDLNQIYFDNNTCTNQTFFIQVMTMYDFQKRLRETCYDKKKVVDRQPEFDW